MNITSHPWHYRQQQSGLSLLVALIALVIMSLAGIALMRLVDSNALIASNAAFRQSARESTDAGIEAARTWLLSAGTALEITGSIPGYYANRTTVLDPIGTVVDWESATAVSCVNGGIPDASGTKVCYVIQRMCDKDGKMDMSTCDTAISTSAKGSGSGQAERSSNTFDLDIGPKPGASTSSVVYRITVRASSVRGNISYVQAFII
jgi:Tfp pilus assembly protein PilX